MNEARLVVNDRLARRALRLRMLGSAAIDLAWLAHGRTDAAIIFGAKAWTSPPESSLVREAAGIVIDAIGTKHTLSSSSTISARMKIRSRSTDCVPTSR